ncbi:MAG TPA: PilZ domain-containing protein [Candidatus Hydrogenedentes bacterium]|nr:PilZ domain-containing protein [Candidatus Hydrogenedentota bacterium]
MLQERRKTVRRQADRDMMQKLQEARRGEDASREERHRRRRAIRHTCKVNMGLRIKHSTGQSDTWSETEHPIAGRILDLSLDGCSIFSGIQLDIGQDMNLVIEVRNGRKIQAAGIVRWTKYVREHAGFASGLQFTAISPKDRQTVDAFLKELDENIGL